MGRLGGTSMTKNSHGVRSLEEKHMVSILMYLGTNGPRRKIDIYNGVSSNPRMPDKLDKLEEIGLLRQEIDPVTRSTIVYLTPHGDQVATMLISIDKCIKTSST